jgi:hypothetical protein
MDSLFKAVEHQVLLGREISFRSEMNCLMITLSGRENSNEQALPLSDHFYEKRVVACIEFMSNELNKKDENN